eukprot:g5828.t1
MKKQKQLLPPPKLVRTFNNKGRVNALSFSPTMKQLASCSEDSSVMIWNFKSQLRAFRYTDHDSSVTDCAFSKDGSLLATSSLDRTLRVWKPTVQGNFSSTKAHAGAVRCVCFSSDGERLLTSGDDKSVKIWSMPSRRFIGSLIGHKNWVNAASFSPDGSLVVSGSDDKTVKIWDASTHKNIGTFHDHNGGVRTCEFSPDGTCVAAGSEDRTIKLWDVRSQQLLQHYPAHLGVVNSIKFHPNGRFLISTSDDGTVKVWDLREGHVLYTLRAHEGPVNGLAISPRGNFFATGGADGLVLVWSWFIQDVEKADHANTLSLSPETSPNQQQHHQGDVADGADVGFDTTSSGTSQRRRLLTEVTRNIRSAGNGGNTTVVDLQEQRMADKENSTGFTPWRPSGCGTGNSATDDARDLGRLSSPKMFHLNAQQQYRSHDLRQNRRGQSASLSRNTKRRNKTPQPQQKKPMDEQREGENSSNDSKIEVDAAAQIASSLQYMSRQLQMLTETVQGLESRLSAQEQRTTRMFDLMVTQKQEEYRAVFKEYDRKGEE